jgi:cell division protein ZapA
MGTITVVVNGRPYSVGCEDGQEDHVAALAREFDRQVVEVGEQVGQVGDIKLFLMAALMGADELAEARLTVASLQSELAARHGEATEARRRAADAIDAAARRIEDFSGRLGQDGASP